MQQSLRNSGFFFGRTGDAAVPVLMCDDSSDLGQNT
jgi:hypothetical protein